MTGAFDKFKAVFLALVMVLSVLALAIGAGGTAVTANEHAGSGNDATGNDATGNDATGNDATGNDATGNDATGNDATGNQDAGDGETDDEPGVVWWDENATLDPDYTIDSAEVRDSKTLTIAYTNPDDRTPQGIANQVGDGHLSGDSTIAYSTDAEPNYLDEMFLHYETSDDIFEALDVAPPGNHSREGIGKFQNSPLSLEVEQANAEDGTPKQLNLSRDASGVYVVPDDGESDNRLYNSSQQTGLFFSFKLNSMQFFEDGEAVQPEIGDEFEATLSIDTEESELEETTSFRIVEGQTEIVHDDDSLTLPASETAQVAANSTKARGTAMGLELTATAPNGTELMSESTGEMTLNGMGPTICCDGPSTGPWGSISSQFDTSDLPAGTNVTARAMVVADLPGEYDDSVVVAEETGYIREPPTASVSVSDQSGQGESVTIDEVETSDGGFVAVRSGSAGGDAIGSTDYLEPGTHEDLEIGLDPVLEEDEEIYVVVHQDTDDDQALDYPEADAPYSGDDGPVTTSVEYTVEGGADTPTTEPPTTEPPTTEPPTEPPTTEPPTTEPSTTTEPPTTEQTTTDTGPGFGAIAALVSMLAAALLAARRRE